MSALLKFTALLALAGAAVASPCAPLPSVSSSAAAVAASSSTSTAAAAATSPPTGTTGNQVSTTVSLTGVTHSVTAGLGGKLVFDPDNVVAQPGDVIEWLFLPKNHSVFQSSFAKPCVPESATSFGSGFFPTASGLNPDVFQVVVNDTEPIWFYCAQTDGNHCQNGMVGVVNQNFSSANTLAAFAQLATKTGVSVAQEGVVGGRVIPNPNPGSSFSK